VRLASLVENGFNAVERISEYANLEEEAPKDIPGSKPDGWPANGLVRILSLTLVTNGGREAARGAVCSLASDAKPGGEYLLAFPLTARRACPAGGGGEGG